MSRPPLFGKRATFDFTLAGLETLTCPTEGVSAVLDIAVLGAKYDGKTQFIKHVFRYGDGIQPLDELSEAERADLRWLRAIEADGRTEANTAARVAHYPFWVRPEKLLAGLDFSEQVAILLGGRWFWSPFILALVNSLVAGVVAFGLFHASPLTAILTFAASFVCLLGLAAFLSVRELARAKPIEIVCWDIAGEDVIADGAGTAPPRLEEYLHLVNTLAIARRARIEPDCRYGFTVALICNPIRLGMRGDRSPYSRLVSASSRFAGFNENHPSVMTVVNRWNLVEAVEAFHDDTNVAVVAPVAAPLDGGLPELPVVNVKTVRDYCVHVEPRRDGSLRREVLKYDADPYAQPVVGNYDWEDLSRSWSAPAARTPLEKIITYAFKERSDSFRDREDKEADRSCCRWLIRAAWTDALTRPEPQSMPEPAPAPVEEPALVEPSADASSPRFTRGT
jgi:hypothetical protein